jgi:pimeloyl-ACP methyl ester carboxylesterase
MWRGVASELSEQITITAPDFPEHGRSGPFPKGKDVHDVSTDAVAPLLDQPMHVVGHSFGGTVALRLALRHPERVKSLALIEPVMFCAASPSAALSEMRQKESDLHQMYHDGQQEEVTRLFNRRWGAGQPWMGYSPQMRQMMIRQMHHVLATGPTIWDDIHDLLLPQRLAKLTCPITLIRGEATDPILRRVHQGLNTRLPQAKDHVVPNAGHMLVLTHPKEVADILKGPFSDVAQASSL